jgi:hypothetical protein
MMETKKYPHVSVIWDGGEWEGKGRQNDHHSEVLNKYVDLEVHHHLRLSVPV